MSKIEWCECGTFKLWYADDLSVCTCGHPDGQHIDRTGLCMGDVTRRRPQSTGRPRTLTGEDL